MQGADEFGAEALLQHHHHVEAPPRSERPDVAQGRARHERSGHRGRLGEQAVQAAEHRGAVPRSVQAGIRGVAPEEGAPERGVAVRGDLVEGAILGDVRQRRGDPERQGQEDSGKKQHGGAALAGCQRTPPRWTQRLPEEEGYPRGHRGEQPEDVSGGIALPDVLHHLGGIHEVVDGHEVEPSIELQEEEDLDHGDEEDAEGGQAEERRHDRPVGAAAVPALRNERQVQDKRGRHPERRQAVDDLAGAQGGEDREDSVVGHGVLKEEKGEPDGEGHGHQTQGERGREPEP